jgi:hypothetical protein
MLRSAATLARAAAALARAAAVTPRSITSRSFLAPMVHEVHSSDRNECQLCGAGPLSVRSVRFVDLVLLFSGCLVRRRA